MSPSVMYRVLHAAEEYDLTIVEDDAYSDFYPDASPRLATLDRLNLVIYVSGFSKTLSQSIRVGFIACRADIAEQLVNIKVLTCITTSEFNERLVYSLLVEGHYRKFIERLRERLSQARVNTLQMMYHEGMETFVDPVGGKFVWARLPHVDDSVAGSDLALKDKILLAPGCIFRPNFEQSPWMRFNVAIGGEPRLQRFLQKASRQKFSFDR
jgi:DNA-binding transcriptional MocR family regulator